MGEEGYSTKRPKIRPRTRLLNCFLLCELININAKIQVVNYEIVKKFTNVIFFYTISFLGHHLSDRWQADGRDIRGG